MLTALFYHCEMEAMYTRYKLTNAGAYVPATTLVLQLTRVARDAMSAMYDTPEDAN